MFTPVSASFRFRDGHLLSISHDGSSAFLNVEIFAPGAVDAMLAWVPRVARPESNDDGCVGVASEILSCLVGRYVSSGGPACPSHEVMALAAKIDAFRQS